VAVGHPAADHHSAGHFLALIRLRYGVFLPALTRGKTPAALLLPTA
jgi:hypothetical protein